MRHYDTHLFFNLTRIKNSIFTLDTTITTTTASTKQPWSVTTNPPRTATRAYLLAISSPPTTPEKTYSASPILLRVALLSGAAVFRSSNWFTHPQETSQLASRREEGLHVVGEVSIRDPEEALAGEDGGEGLRRTLDYRSKEFR